MSTKSIQNAIGTALVLAVFAVGSVLGYTLLGGNAKPPANAETPTSTANPSTGTSSSCLLCIAQDNTATRTGGLGSAPPAKDIPNASQNGTGGTGGKTPR